MLKLKKIFVLILLLSILIPVFASGDNWYEGQTITSIEFEGLHNVKVKTANSVVSQYIGKAFDDAYQMSKVVVVSSYKLLSGSISATNISGPIAIAKGAQESASYGLFIFLGFLAAISVNLGILNLLPIPVLDGGQLLFLAYEALMRREPSARAQMVLTSCGAAVLLTLMLFAVFNDLQGL